MNTLKTVSSSKVDAKVAQKPQIVEIQPAGQDTSTQELTLGQRLADKFAAQVGSWGFLIGQSTVLVAKTNPQTGTIEFNVTPAKVFKAS